MAAVSEPLFTNLYLLLTRLNMGANHSVKAETKTFCEIQSLLSLAQLKC